MSPADEPNGGLGLERLAYFALERVAEFDWNMQANQGSNLARAHAF
jgi:hypothetical protein